MVIHPNGASSINAIRPAKVSEVFFYLIHKRKFTYTLSQKSEFLSFFMIGRLAGAIPAALTILGGIYTNEGALGFDGKIRMSNRPASPDSLSDDMVGPAVPGYGPQEVPYLVSEAQKEGRSLRTPCRDGSEGPDSGGCGITL